MLWLLSIMMSFWVKVKVLYCVYLLTCCTNQRFIIMDGSFKHYIQFQIHISFIFMSWWYGTSSASVFILIYLVWLGLTMHLEKYFHSGQRLFPDTWLGLARILLYISFIGNGTDSDDWYMFLELGYRLDNEF